MLTNQQRHTILGLVARYYFVTPTEVLCRSRIVRIAQARQMTVALLVAGGDRVSDTARFLHRNHATCCHALHHVKTAVHFRTAWNYLLPLAVPSLLSIDQCITHAAAQLGREASHDISTYLSLCILGRPGHVYATGAYRGLLLLTAYPAITDQIAAALEAHYEDGAATLLRYQVAKRITS